MGPPFRNFRRPRFYTYQILLDLKVEKGMAMRDPSPHPRFLCRPDRHRADRGCPRWCATGGRCLFFWPCFKAPAEGRTHISSGRTSRFAQIIVIPEEAFLRTGGR